MIWSTSPIFNFALIGAGIGMAKGVYHVVRKLADVTRKEAAKKIKATRDTVTQTCTLVTTSFNQTKLQLACQSKALYNKARQKQVRIRTGASDLAKAIGDAFLDRRGIR